MNKTKTRSAKRILAIALALLTIIAMTLAMTSCFSCTGDSETSKFRAMEKNESFADYTAALLMTNESAKLRIIAVSKDHIIAPKAGETVLQDNTTVITDEEKLLSEANTVLLELIDATSFSSTGDKEDLRDWVKRDDFSLADVDAIVASENIQYEVNLNREVGFPGVILVGIGWLLGQITNLFGGFYVLALIVFALMVEILMLPVAIKQQKNSIGLAKLRPAIAKIEKKYAGRNDPITMQKKREEIMALQQKEGYSPFSGCMPMLLQLLVVGFILYPIIQNPAYYMLGQSEELSSALTYFATAPKAVGGLGMTMTSNGSTIEVLSNLYGQDLSGLETFIPFSNGGEILKNFQDSGEVIFTAFGINLGAVPTFASILVLVPILNIGIQWLTMFFSKRWNQTGMNAMPQDGQSAASMKIMELLPLALTFFIIFQIPAMIGVYWFIRSLISLGKQYLIKLAMPIPKYTAEQIKEMEKLEKEREKAQKAALKAQPKIRSLHYIDDDDYDDLVEVKNNDAAKHVSSDAPEIKD